MLKRIILLFPLFSLCSAMDSGEIQVIAVTFGIVGCIIVTLVVSLCLAFCSCSCGSNYERIKTMDTPGQTSCEGDDEGWRRSDNDDEILIFRAIVIGFTSGICVGLGVGLGLGFP
jgi:hypothetical protein